jgi:hypothetical protein
MEAAKAQNWAAEPPRKNILYKRLSLATLSLCWQLQTEDGSKYRQWNVGITVPTYAEGIS